MPWQDDLLKGDALRVYENFIHGLPQDTPETAYEDSIKALAVHVFPIRALRLQKQYMRRFLRKPMAMTTREFVTRVQQINDYLEYFPPFADEQKLPEDELLDILEFSIPNSWQAEFIRLGYDPLTGDLKSFIDHCERMETFEAVEQKGKFQAWNTTDDKSTFTKGPRANSHSRNGDHMGLKSGAKSSAEAHNNNCKFCKLHGTYGHDLSTCKVMITQAKKMKEAWKSAHPSTTTTPRRGNNKCSFTSDSMSKEEINSMVTSAIEITIPKINQEKKMQ